MRGLDSVHLRSCCHESLPRQELAASRFTRKYDIDTARARPSLAISSSSSGTGTWAPGLLLGRLDEAQHHGNRGVGFDLMRLWLALS